MSRTIIDGKVTVVMPTYNRAYCLVQTVSSYLSAACVAELILVNDGSDDNTLEVFQELCLQFGKHRLRLISHHERLGAAAARKTGVESANTEYIMFGEDDVIIDNDYIEKLLIAISEENDIASGRIVYLQKNENIENAKIRFKKTQNTLPFINGKLIQCNHNHFFKQDEIVPFSHALYLSRRSLLVKLGFDITYRQGTGYREETDTQMLAFSRGHKHLMVHNAYCFHLDFSESRTGGQRTTRLKQWYWNIALNSYFLRKHKSAIHHKLGINHNNFILNGLFIINQTNIFIIRPIIIKSRSVAINTIKFFSGASRPNQ